MGKVKIELVIEKSGDSLWGRVNYNDNLFADTAADLSELEKKIIALLFDFEGLPPEQIEFEYFYDVYCLLQQFDFLNISKVAVHAGINPSLLRQYASGVKNRSSDQAKKIEKALHELPEGLMQALVYSGG